MVSSPSFPYYKFRLMILIVCKSSMHLVTFFLNEPSSYLYTFSISVANKNGLFDSLLSSTMLLIIRKKKSSHKNRCKLVWDSSYVTCHVMTGSYLKTYRDWATESASHQWNVDVQVAVVVGVASSTTTHASRKAAPFTTCCRPARKNTDGSP